MSPQVDAVIRATARIQEANEPPRQKPIIKLDARHQQELMAAAVRASIDSGRDNPFRPDGEIYKLTNPIVDYYKFGPNQSRSVTPTYAELDYYSSKNKRRRRAEARRRAAGDSSGRPCWRRWLCCCCCCCRWCSGNDGDRVKQAAPVSQAATGPNGLDQTQQQEQELEQHPSMPPPLVDSRQRLAAGAAIQANTETTEGSDLRQAPAVAPTTTAAAAASSSNGGAKLVDKKGDKANKSKQKKQTRKKVVLDEEALGGRQANDKDNNNKDEPKTTKVKTVKTSRCVIS